jgi:RHS repeat-associated protein
VGEFSHGECSGQESDRPIGEPRDAATGLTYPRARDYAPGNGRFLQPDGHTVLSAVRAIDRLSPDDLTVFIEAYIGLADEEGNQRFRGTECSLGKHTHRSRRKPHPESWPQTH